MRAASHPSGTPVTVIGHQGRLVSTVAFLIGAGHSVRVLTADAETERLLAPYPDVVVEHLPEYARPERDPQPPFLLALDAPELIAKVRAWLPPTRAVFLLGSSHRRRQLTPGALSLLPAQSHMQAEVRERFATLARVDALIAIARGQTKAVILLYGDPDPDAIGAALGVAVLWRSVGVEAAIRYTGEIQRYQNRLLLSWLKQPIERLREGELADAGAVALVDAQPGFWADAPPHVDAVIDHHPLRDDTKARCVDVRIGYGSTSTMLVEYLVAAEMPLPRRLATALLYGLITDTDDLKRNASSRDIRAYDVLHDRADRDFITRLEKSQVPMAALDFIAWGISHRVTCRDMVLVHFGVVPSSDILVQVADLLLLTCGISWVAVAGVRRRREQGDRLVVIFRGDGHHQDVGKRASRAFGEIGSAGGHKTMGRAEIPVDGAQLEGTVELLVDRLFARMSPRRRAAFKRTLKAHLDAPRPPDPDAFEI